MKYKTDSFSEIFSDFYKDILADQMKIKSMDDVTEEVTEQISNKYIEKINLKLESVFKDESDINYLNIKEFAYLITAFIDESFIRLEWSGSKYWENNLIEEKVFKTHIAGSNIFQKIDIILNHTNYFKVEIAKIYFEILSLGFTGKYGNDIHNAKLQNYKNQLFGFIYQNIPYLEINSKKLMDLNYEYTVAGAKNKNHFNKQKKWSLLIICVIFLYFSSIFYTWNKNTKDLNSEIKSIFQTIEVNYDKV